MAKGITCYERDEMLCDDPGCLHGGGCKLRVVVAQGKPAAWIAFSGEGYVRFWTADADRANAEKQAGLDLRAFTLDELVALISRIPIAKAMAGILAERASAKQPPVEDLVEAIALAAGDLSEHIEKYHDYEFEPGAEPPERGSLRGIQHHLEGSLIDDRGNPVRCSPAEKASEADQQADAIKAMAETEQTDVEFLLQALDQRLLDSIDARNIVKSFRKQIIQVAASCSSQPVTATSYPIPPGGLLEQITSENAALRAQIGVQKSALHDIAASEPIPTPHEGWKFCRDIASAALTSTEQP